MLAHEKTTERNEEENEEEALLSRDVGTDLKFKRDIVWINVLGFLALHFAALFGLIRLFKLKLLTLPWTAIVLLFSGEAITLGAHRMYAHNAFKGTFIVRLGVLILHTLTGQNCLYIWVRDHRQHHKYTDSDADPHNSKRGFFFAHMGWLMSRKHPEVIKRGKSIDMRDLEQDELVMLQKRHYKFLYLIFAIGIPVAVPIYLWNETFINSMSFCFFTRYIFQLHATWLINSAAHLYGYKPYDDSMSPVENYYISFLALGEGWHNYHHVFPYDYRAAEYGLRYSVTTFVIDILAIFGLVYDLKEAQPESVKMRIKKKGDGSHPVYGNVPH